MVEKDGEEVPVRCHLAGTPDKGSNGENRLRVPPSWEEEQLCHGRAKIQLGDLA